MGSVRDEVGGGERREQLGVPDVVGTLLVDGAAVPLGDAGGELVVEAVQDTVTVALNVTEALPDPIGVPDAV